MLFVLLFNISIALSQDLATLKNYYESLQFEKTIQYGKVILKKQNTFTPKELLQIHQYLGFAYFNLDQKDSARVQFLTILNIDPDFQLDPVTTSPKIIAFFEQLKAMAASNQRLKQAATVRYVFEPDRRPAASWRSMLLPGWGQYYKGHKKSAFYFFTGFVTGISLTVTAAVLEQHYHQKYKSITNVNQLAQAYRVYNRWYKIRQSSSYFTIAVWLSSVLDALWRPENKNASLSIETANQQTAVKVSLNF